MKLPRQLDTMCKADNQVASQAVAPEDMFDCEDGHSKDIEMVHHGTAKPQATKTKTVQDARKLYSVGAIRAAHIPRSSLIHRNKLLSWLDQAPCTAIPPSVTHSNCQLPGRMPTWESLNNGICHCRAVAYVGNDAPARSQPLPQLLPNLHLHSRQHIRQPECIIPTET